MYVHSSQYVSMYGVNHDGQLKLTMCEQLERTIIIARQVTAADAALPARVAVAEPPRERSV